MWSILTEVIVFGLMMWLFIWYYWGFWLGANKEVKFKAVVDEEIKKVRAKIKDLKKDWVITGDVDYKIERVLFNSWGVVFVNYNIILTDGSGNHLSADKFNKVVAFVFWEQLKNDFNFKVDSNLNVNYLKSNPMCKINFINCKKNYFFSSTINNINFTFSSCDDNVIVWGELNRQVNLGDGSDILTISSNAKADINLGKWNDKVFIFKNLESNLDAWEGCDLLTLKWDSNWNINLWNGFDLLSVLGNLNWEVLSNGKSLIFVNKNINNKVTLWSNSDFILVKGNINWKINMWAGDDKIITLRWSYSGIDLWNWNDKFIVCWKLEGKVDGWEGEDYIKLISYTKEDYEFNKDWIKDKLSNIEHIIFKNTSIADDFLKLSCWYFNRVSFNNLISILSRDRENINNQKISNQNLNTSEIWLKFRNALKKKLFVDLDYDNSTIVLSFTKRYNLLK